MSRIGSFLNFFLNFVTGTSLNRIGRAKYVARTMIFCFFMIVCSLLETLLQTALESPGLNRLSYILFSLFLVVSVCGIVYLNNKRFHDCGVSGWWQLLLCIPTVNLFVIIYLWFSLGDKGKNEYGEQAETKTREKILARILPISFFAMIYIMGDRGIDGLLFLFGKNNL